MPLTRAAIAYQLKLPNGETAIVFRGGVAQVFTKDHRKVETQILQPAPRYDEDGTKAAALPERGRAMAELSAGPQHPYAPNELVVAYRDGITGTRDLLTVSKPVLRTMREGVAHHALASVTVPSYTNDFTLNRLLGSIGIDRSERLFRHLNRSAIEALGSRAPRFGQRRLNFANAYLLHVSAASVPQAVALLEKSPAVAYVSPNWTVAPMHAAAIPLKDRAVQAAHQRDSAMKWRPAQRTQRMLANALPNNYTLTSSGQSMLNSPSMDAAAAFDEIDAKFHQLPGQGETITNVSLGDLDDSSAASNSSDPCNFYASVYGPTTVLQGGQRYLDLPSMPLIPTYTADVNGNVSGTGEVCGVDPYITEVGLDFSMMSPLPHNVQRGGEQGSGDTDLLGIAPGANYRLVVPVASTIVNIDAALLAAALQSPHPDVITASLGFGEDVYGFPSRYLEEDPLTEAVVESIVHNYHVVVCISSGDGTRTFTTAAIGPSGGSAATDVVASGETPTNLNDDFLSTIPSVVYDSGAVDVGGTTLDDIFANPPQYAHGPIVAQHAYAETRWTGFTSFSSGFGSRVNVSAPSDNVISFEHPFGGSADSVGVVLEGGTSASAPLTAAAAAVFLQVARLTGHPFTDPLKVRAFIASTGTPVPPVSQADTTVNVGPQVDVRAGVEALIDRTSAGSPNVARVAVEQRRDYAELNGAFLSDTDPTNIDLANGARPGANELSWITIAPDWEFIPGRASYALYVTGHPREVIASTPWARVLPATILQAAGMPLVSSSSRTVNLTYAARTGFKVLASTTVSLTFGAAPALRNFEPAPQVASTSTGSTIPVTYDASDVGNLNSPRLVVSEPGRVDPATGQLFHPAYSVPLNGTKGTMNVPTSALQGGGIYGVGIELDSVNGIYSNFAFTRVTTTSHRPSAPLLSYNGSTPGHNLTIPYGGSFQVAYDVSNVPNADGAKLEISAAGAGAWGIYNPFNNPNGTIQDKNGVDSGSIYYVPVMGTKGTVTVNAVTAGLYPTLDHVVRVIPTRGGMPAGEGGDVSTVSMNGVFALDGGYVNNGWGVNAAGSDGFITSGQQLADGEIITSLENFSQTNNAIVQNIAAGSSSLYFTNGWGVYGNDIGLFGDENTSTFASTYNLLNTVASGTIGSAWTPSGYPSSFFIDEGAANEDNDNAAFYGYDTSVNHYKLFTSNLTANTFSSLYDIQGPVSSFVVPLFWGVGENTATSTAVLPADDAANAGNPPTMVLVNLATGTPTAFTGLGSGFPYGIGVDSVTNKAAVPTLFDGGLSIYNLATQTGVEVQLPPSPTQPLNGFYTMADQKAGQFLVEQTAAPDFVSNNNSLSRILTYDENGNLLKAIERFDLFNTFLTIQTNNLQVNPTTRTGYLIGPGQQQLAPFQY